jgi:peptide/nickel transport system ATP-binding protein
MPTIAIGIILMTQTLLELYQVSKLYGSKPALQALSLRIEEERAPIITIAGESGSGKTTLASLLLGFIEPSSGEIRYRGRPLRRLRGADRKVFRREVQAVFQDPFAVYNPFYRVDHTLLEPLRLFGLSSSRREARSMMEAACKSVGLHPEDTLGRFPHQLSGGQRQRLMVARALLLKPRILITDEPVSMIDASLRALVLGNLKSLSCNFNIPIIYITHDLTTAYHIADVIMVLYRGRVVEAGPADSVIEKPEHPYTQLLVDSIPWPDPDIGWGKNQPILKENRNISIHKGCDFATRCPAVMSACRTHVPPFYSTGEGKIARCLLHNQQTEFDIDRLSELLKLSGGKPDQSKR